MPTVVPNAPASASKSARPSAAAKQVVPHAPEPAAPETNGFLPAQRTPTHRGWIIQIGAFDIERDAQRQLSSVPSLPFAPTASAQRYPQSHCFLVRGSEAPLQFTRDHGRLCLLKKNVEVGLGQPR